MKLNIQFKEGRSHAWLVTSGAPELFIHRPMESLTITAGSLTCWLPSHQVEEIRAGALGMPSDPKQVFLCCATPKETKLYSVLDSVTYAGGDVLLFIKPLATFH